MFSREIFQAVAIFFFSSSFSGLFFLAPIMFECYQSGCNPANDEPGYMTGLFYSINPYKNISEIL